MKITEKNIKTAISDLAKLNIELEAKGGPERAGRLFEKTFGLQDDILRFFELPSTPMYQSLLEFDKMPWDTEIDNRIEMLKKQSAEYKRFGAASELEQLKKSVEQEEDDMTALPKIGVITHVYTLWLYNTLLKPGKETAENILAELKLSENNHDMLGQCDSLQNIMEYPDTQYEAEMKKYDEKGFKYWRQFIEPWREELKKLFKK